MKATDYAPAGPVEQALRDALSGVELGAYDERILTWLAGWDDSTVRTVVGLILRARARWRCPVSPLRKGCALVCTVWLVVAAIRINLAVHGHPGSKASLAFTVVSAVFGVLGLYYALTPRR